MPGTKSKPLAAYLDKTPSATNERFVKFVKEQVGYDADLRTVHLYSTLYHRFQSSPENKAANAAERDANAKARTDAKAAAEQKRAASQAKKDELAEKRAQKAAKSTPAKKAPAKAPAAKKATPAKSAPAKKAATPRPRARKATAGGTGQKVAEF